MALFQSTDEEIEFWSIFLDKYRESVYLWSTDPKLTIDRNKYRVERQKCFVNLVRYCRRRFATANVDFVNQKIRSFSSLFRKNYKKVLKCRNEGVIYNPSLWYYKKLLFLVQENNSEQFPATSDAVNDDTSTSVQQNQQKRKHSNCELNDNVEIKSEIVPDDDALDIEIINAANELNNIDKNNVNVDDDDEVSSVSATNYHQKQFNSNNNNNSSSTTDLLFDKCNPMAVPKSNTIDQMARTAIEQFEKLSKMDSCDASGTKLAFDLREMTDKQRQLTERIISEVIYYGKRRKLRNSFAFRPN